MIRSSQSPAPDGTTATTARKYGSTIMTMTIATAAALRRTMAPMARASTANSAARTPVPMITRASAIPDMGNS